MNSFSTRDPIKEEQEKREREVVQMRQEELSILLDGPKVRHFENRLARTLAFYGDPPDFYHKREMERRRREEAKEDEYAEGFGRDPAREATIASELITEGHKKTIHQNPHE
jgi:hypothetical protein